MSTYAITTLLKNKNPMVVIMIFLRVFWFIVYAGLIGLLASIIFIGFILKSVPVNILSSYYTSWVSVHGIFSMILVLISVFWWLFNWRHGGRSSILLESSALLLLVLFSTVVSSRASSGWTLYPPLNSDLGAALLFTIVLYFFMILLDAFFSSVVARFAFNVRSGARNIAIVGFIFTVLYALFLIPAIFRLVDILFSSTILVYPNGSALTYIELFWVFGHPVVYFFILPVIIFFFKMSVQVNTTVGADSLLFIVLNSLLSVWLFSSFNVWGHHLFTNIFSSVFLILFSLASLFIAVPMGLCLWYFLRFSLRSVYNHAVLLAVEMSKPAKVIAFVAALGFVVGGATGLFLLVPSNDIIVHGTRFIVGHFHAFLVIFVLAGFLILFFLKLDWAVLQGKEDRIYSKLGAVRPAILFGILCVFTLLLFTGTSLETRRAFNLVGSSGQFTVFTGISRALDLAIFFILLFGFFFNHSAPILSGFFLSRKNKRRLRILMWIYRFLRRIEQILDRANLPQGWMRRSCLLLSYLLILLPAGVLYYRWGGCTSFPEHYFLGDSILKDLFSFHPLSYDPSIPFGSKKYYLAFSDSDPGFIKLRETLTKYKSAIDAGLSAGTLPFIFVFLLRALSYPELTLYYCELFQASFKLLYLSESPNIVLYLNNILQRGKAEGVDIARLVNQIWGIRDVCDSSVPDDLEADRLYAKWRSLVQQFLHHDYSTVSLNSYDRVQEWNALREITETFFTLDNQYIARVDFSKLYVPEVARKQVGNGLLFDLHFCTHKVLSGSVEPEVLCALVTEEAALIPRIGPVLRLLVNDVTPVA